MSEYLAISDDIKKGEFSICWQNDKEFCIKYSGKFNELSDSFGALIAMAKVKLEGNDIYLIVNKNDVPDADFDDEGDGYDPSGD